MLRADKEAVVKDLRDALGKAEGVLFLDFTGLTVFEADSFRRKLQESEIRYTVVKNTLMQRALEDQPFADVASCLKGSPTGVIMGFEDPVTGPKIVFEYMKGCRHLKVKGGVVESKAIGPAEAESLSKMPSRTEMQGQIVALALSPGGNIVGQLMAPSGNIVGAIESLVERLEKGEAA